MKFSEPDIEAILKRAGWFPSRSISQEILHLPLTQKLPKKVLDVFIEFGNLTFVARNNKNEIVYEVNMMSTTEMFHSESLLNLFENNEFEDIRSINIELGHKNSIYYYSFLLGTQLYPICDLKIEQGILLMDELGNVYIIDGISNLTWIARDFLTGMERLLFNMRNGASFYEETLEWVFKEGEIPAFTPPTNKILNGKNPFFTKK